MPVTFSDAPKGADILIVTIPQKAVPGLPKDLLKDLPAGATVIDTGNYYPQERDGLIAEIEGGTTESRWVVSQLSHPVVKAFNGIYAANLLARFRPADAPDRLALPIAGDDATAKKVVADLVDELGFDPVDAGGLEESWRQQPATPVYGLDAGVDGVRAALAAATPDRTEAFSA